jgi:HK97 family phage major capsid protein
MSKYLTPAQQEIRTALNEADEISKRSEITKRDEARLSFLLAKCKALQNGTQGEVSDETPRFFRSLFKGHDMRTVSPMQEGTQTISYTAGAEGGFLVPTQFHNDVIVAAAQFDPLLNKNIVTLIESSTLSLNPYIIPGWDLSTFSATLITEGSQQTGQVAPLANNTTLKSFKYSASVPLTTELEDDMFEPATKLVAQAFGIGFGRGIGADLTIGTGSGMPQGVVNASDSGYTTAALGVVTQDDIEAVYFDVNAFYRNAPKCAWLMNDAAYKQVRKAKDASGKLLLNVSKDEQILMGKPVYICPSLPAYNASLGTQGAGSFCVFGDLSYLMVRVSRLAITRSMQAPGFVEKGLALYRGNMRADAKIFNPAGSSNPPIVTARLHS